MKSAMAVHMSTKRAAIDVEQIRRLSKRRNLADFKLRRILSAIRNLPLEFGTPESARTPANGS
jgi:hypothetical protein